MIRLRLNATYANLLDDLLTGAEGDLDGAVNHRMHKLLDGPLHRWTYTVPQLRVSLEDGQLHTKNTNTKIMQHLHWLVILGPVLGQLPTKDNSPPDKNKAQPLPTRTTDL